MECISIAYVLVTHVCLRLLGLCEKVAGEQDVLELELQRNGI